MRVRVCFFSIMLFISFFLTEPVFAFSSCCAVILHELGHVFCAKCFDIRLKEFNIGIYGAGITPLGSGFSYLHEILLCLSGPFINLVSLPIALFFYSLTNWQFCMYLAAASLVLGAMNLLPIKTFDGGRIIHALICSLFSQKCADTVLNITSFTFIFFLWTLSVYTLLLTESGLSLFVFSISLFSRFFIE